MKIADFMKEVFEWTDPVREHYQTTCDTLKAGNPDAELGNRVAVTMFATTEVIRAAAAWGAKLLIVHEPVFYEHWDSMETFRQRTGFTRMVLDRKLQLIQDSGLTIYRYHDHPHRRVPDMISEGACRAFGLKGCWQKGDAFGINRFVLNQPMTVNDIARTLETHLQIRQVRRIGCTDADFFVSTIGLCFGTPGHVEDELEFCDLLLTGEVCEWAFGEFVRDCNGLGIRKAILVMGHCCSEREGMRLLAELLPQQERWKHLDLSVRYFESGDIYVAASEAASADRDPGGAFEGAPYPSGAALAGASADRA